MYYMDGLDLINIFVCRAIIFAIYSTIGNIIKRDFINVFEKYLLLFSNKFEDLLEKFYDTLSSA